MNVGNRIIKIRDSKGWSQRELARRVDINPSVMNRIESGTRPLKDSELAKIAQVLDVSTDYLLGRSNNHDININNKYKVNDSDLMDIFKEDEVHYKGRKLSKEEKEQVEQMLSILLNKKDTD